MLLGLDFQTWETTIYSVRLDADNFVLSLHNGNNRQGGVLPFPSSTSSFTPPGPHFAPCAAYNLHGMNCSQFILDRWAHSPISARLSQRGKGDLSAKSQSNGLVTIRRDYAKRGNWTACEQIGDSTSTSDCGNLQAFHDERKKMPSKNTYVFNGKPVTGESVGIESSNEPWAQYVLADGTAVKVKIVLLDAVRLDEFNETNDPIYQFQFQQIIGVVAPDKLKRKVH